LLCMTLWTLFNIFTASGARKAKVSKACDNYSRHTTQPLLKTSVYRKRPVEQFEGLSSSKFRSLLWFLLLHASQSSFANLTIYGKSYSLFSAASTAKCISRLTSLILRYVIWNQLVTWWFKYIKSYISRD
jgi:hypothetical protein